MKYIVTFILFLPIIVSAQIAIGAKKATDTAILIHDFHMFDIYDEDNFGLLRYGVGRGQMEISDRLGVTAESRSGVFLYKDSPFNLGLELAAGKIGYHDRAEYQWQPGMSIGLKEIFGSISFYVGPRAGLSYENHTNTGFMGAVGTIEIFNVGATYWSNDYSGDKQSLCVYDLNAYNKINVQKRLENGEESWSIGYRMELH